MQTAEAAELVLLIRLRPCRYGLKSCKVQNLAAVRKKRFVIPHAQECGLSAISVGCGTGAERRLGWHADTFLGSALTILERGADGRRCDSVAASVEDSL
jgi:hypothetical protein